MISNNQNQIQCIAENLFPHWCGVVSPENSNLIKSIKNYIPLKVHRFSSGLEFNGWTVPNSWKVKRARIFIKDKVVFDGMQHPLCVAAMSKSFSGKLSWSNLSKHIHTRPDNPHAYGYHCMWQYRPWDADWCFCVPHANYVKWPKNEMYKVDLQTSNQPGTMLVGEYEIPGESEQTIVINAHTCHPMQANDDILGVALAIALFNEIKKKKNRYTYRLILGPEHLGTVFYLNKLSEKMRRRIIGGYFLEMPGTKYPIKIASSFLGESVFDSAIRDACKKRNTRYKEVGWRQGAGNDETVWEAPGYEIPFIEVSRCNKTFNPFNEYHTSRDTINRANINNANEFFNILRDTIKIIEKTVLYKRIFNGLPCLSNPKYKLYIERPDPSVKKGRKIKKENWGFFSDGFLRHLNGIKPISWFSDKYGIPENEIKKYFMKMESKRLIKRV
jgi:aminopeptidase-like protein